nr:hypothetical protein [uncultured Prevotella sp.]
MFIFPTENISFREGNPLCAGCRMPDYAAKAIYIKSTRSHGGDGGKANITEVPMAQRAKEMQRTDS